ncbi:hypothetical protein [Streptomyces sp. MCL20-2]|uniref:hypothetical protein n=1 Tax=Streptomyces sp. MCL20-2 TaxID=2967219 RepID=UPI0029665169|nr:hypothetical protein [Streptomyces sp. MCL20-2]
MTTQPERIHHLLDRARRGVILPAEGEQLAELVGHLVAAQCTDRRHTCEQHHLPPVDGCPYPRCRAARATGRAATA